MNPPAHSDLPPPMNHVLVDFENVPQVDPSMLGHQAASFTLLLGAKQTKLDAALVEKLMEHAASVQLVRLSASSRNAVDFALAYYLGRLALADPTAIFHIISKDTGYDPLIGHLRSRNLDARRHKDFTTLSFGAPAKPLPTPTKALPAPARPMPAPAKALPALTEGGLLSRAIAYLRKNTNNRPKRKKTLVSHLLAFAGKTTSEAEILALIEKLREAGHLSLSDKGAVAYHV